MGPEPQTEVDEDISEAIKESKAEARMPRVAAGTLLGHTSLWPKGMPSFPGSERSTPTHTPTHSDEYEE